MARLDGSCFRYLVDIDAAEYAQMPIGLLRDAVSSMRRALDGPPHFIFRMMEPELLAELLERLPRLPATCTEKMDVGKEFDPTSVPLTFLHPTVLDEVVREAPKICNLPDAVIDLIVERAQESLPGIMIFGENDSDRHRAPFIARGLPHYPVRFARPVSMAADGTCTIEEMRYVPIGPDVLEPDTTRYNEFVPVDEPVDVPTTRIRFGPNNDAYYGPGRWTSVRDGLDEYWSTWDGLPAKARVVR